MTPALGLLLTTCVLMASPAKEEDPAARAQATLQRVSKLPLEHQRVWLRLIEQRYGWAVLLSLKPEDAQREQARVAKIVRKKTVGWNDLISLLRQLDQREKAAIARLVRQYRSDVYETFRKQPRDLVDRQEAWYRIWSLWEKAGSPPEQQDRLMDWLADAIKASNKASISSLPADPKFGDDVQLVPEQLVKQLSQPPTGKPDETKPTMPRPPVDEILPGPELQARPPLPLRLPDPRRAFGLTKLPSEAVVVRQGEKIAWLPLRAEIPPVVMPPLHNLPPIAADDPLDLTTPPVPLHQALVIIEREALTIPGSSPELVAKAGTSDVKPQAIGSQRQPPELPPRTIEPPPSEQSNAGSVLVTVGPRAISRSESVAIETENPRERASHQDVVGQLPHKLAEFASPRPERPTEYRVERKSLGLDQHAQVNVEELGTRIEGINLSLRNLEAELNEKRDFTADQLDSLLSRLDILVLRQKDLTLFRDLIASQEQAKVGQIDSARSIVATMGTHIAELRTRIRENEALPEAERTSSLKQLDELSDRLATITAEK